METNQEPKQQDEIEEEPQKKEERWVKKEKGPRSGDLRRENREKAGSVARRQIGRRGGGRTRPRAPTRSITIGLGRSRRGQSKTLSTLFPLLPRFKRRRGGLKWSVRPTCTDVVTSLPDEMDMRPSMCLICLRWQTLMHVYPMISDVLILWSRCLDALSMYTPLMLFMVTIFRS